MISVCVAVHRVHAAPNAASLRGQLDAALEGEQGELVLALNGVDAASLGVEGAVRSVDLAVNRGVAPAWNAAALEAGGEILVFCNDDVELGGGSLARLAEALRELPEAVVGPVGSRWDMRAGRHVAWVGPFADPAHPPQPCDVVSGFLFACTRATWEAVGGFDEFYAPASWEEVDYCAAVEARGGGCFVVSAVECRHEWGVSRRQPPWARARWDGRSETWRSIHRRNKAHFLEKWSGSAPQGDAEGRAGGGDRAR
jgi:GT2 family glycosyltransferase